jgi:hypothetical protein
LAEILKRCKEVEWFTCALKDGYMLYQGKMTIYNEYLRFNSSFNPNTFFGSTDILIPKYDLYEIRKGKHILTLLILVLTKKGSIEFTSFFSDPFDILVDVYLSNRYTECDGNTNNQVGEEERPFEIGELKQKMETVFVQMMMK